MPFLLGAAALLASALLPGCGPKIPTPGIDTLWTRAIGGTADDQAQAVQALAGGGYAVAGFTHSYGAGGNDYYLLRLGEAGSLMWDRTYGSTRDEQAYGVALTGDAGYALCGFTNSIGAGTEDVYLVRTDSLGDTLWTRTFGGTTGDAGYDLARLPDSGFAVCGIKGSDIYLIRTDRLGDTLWTRTFGGSGNDFGKSLVLTSDGGFVICGATNSFGSGLSDVYLLKVDGSGSLIWSKTFGGSKNDWGTCVIETSDGGLAVCGYTESFGHGGFDCYVIKTDASGDTVWARTFGGGGNESGYSCVSRPDGSIAVCGFTDSWGHGGFDVYLIKVGPDGGLEWSAVYGGPADDVAYSLKPTPDGGYIAAGYSKSFGLGSADIYILKTAPEE